MHARIILLITLTAGLWGCAAVQPVNTGSPSLNAPAYPVLLPAKAQRAEAASAAWAQLLNQQGVAAGPSLVSHPITATIARLPDNLSGSLHLPKVGTSKQMNDEEAREALRRFLTEWKTLIGAEPAQLSLVSENSANDGTRTAHYEQRPFSYPLSGDYGKVEVRFGPDGRVLSLSSSAIPESERIQTALKTTVPKITADQIPAKLVGRALAYADATGAHSFSLSSASQVNVKQLVIYPRIATGLEPALELHLAWEISLTGAPARLIYLDALQDQVLAVFP